MSMIVPARWYAGGKGLDDFRSRMLHDNSIREIHDYPEASDCFSGVQIKGGVCYFLWNRDDKGNCTVVTHRGNDIGTPMSRPLLEKGCDFFIRYNEAIGILHKIFPFGERSIESLVSSRQPFGLSTTYHGHRQKVQGDVKIYENEGVSYASRSDITKNLSVIDKWKVFIPRAGSGSDAFPHPILGKPLIGEPNSACSETYIFIGPFESREMCINTISYIATRFFRFLAMLKKVTQSTTKSIYTLVPQQDLTRPWTDSDLYSKYDISDDEISFIESMIRPMDAGGGDDDA
ncbi:MAG: Eco57I restriction-modification methylase domain-containing protein [Clostridia bacterium]|nr:Eco57I restriction-modification methylase domain-containing protein [Clostridia bacterium]